MATNAPPKSKFCPKIFSKKNSRAVVVAIALPIGTEVRAEAFLINDAISQAVHTNPGVGEAAANRRATETDLYQAQGAYLPQVRLESRIGPEKFNQVIQPEPFGNGSWFNGKQ